MAGESPVRKQAGSAVQALAGHAIVGDPSYCQLSEVKEDDVFEGWMLKGLYLFAAELQFEHPVDGLQLRFCVECPKKFDEPVGRVKKKARRKKPLHAEHGHSSAVDQEV
jgi:hypothetical protein